MKKRTGQGAVGAQAAKGGAGASNTQSLEQSALALAAELHEPGDTPLSNITRLIQIRGIDFARGLARDATAIQAEGGMMLAAEGRARTLGGIFFRLVRDSLTPEEKRQVFKRAKTERKRKRKRKPSSGRERVDPGREPPSSVDLYLETLKPEQRAAVGIGLDEAARILGFAAAREIAWSALTRDAIEEARDDLEAAKIRRSFVALVKTTGHTLGLGKDWSDDLVAPLKRTSQRWAYTRGEREVHRPDVEAKAGRVIAYCEQQRGRKAKRDAAVLRLQYREGLSPAAIAGLLSTDYDPETGRIRVDGALQRVEEATQEALRRWVEARGKGAGRLFGSGQTGITPFAIGQLLQEYTRSVQEDPANLT